MAKRYFPAFSLIVLIAFFAGCASTRPVSRANQALGQLSLGNSRQAWQMISDERTRPTVSSLEDLCELHLATLKILLNIVDYDYAPADPDSLAKDSYDYVSRNCGNNKKVDI